MMASAEQRKSNGENKVKLADIAKQTGYSLATVSKALNGKADISEVARQAIDKALKDNGYIRRVSLSRKQRTIEVVFRDFETIWALEVLRGIITEAKPHNINVMVAESGDRQHPDSSWVEGIIDRQPIGAILVFSNLTDKERSMFQSHGIPFVVFDPSGNPALDDLSVQADNWMGGVIAIRHLLELGHKRIGIITGPDEMLCSRARLDGYSAALAERMESKPIPNLSPKAISPRQAVTKEPWRYLKTNKVARPPSLQAMTYRPWAFTRRPVN